MHSKVLRIVAIIVLLAMAVIGLVVIAIAAPEVDAKLYMDETGVYMDQDSYEDRVLTCSIIQQKGMEHEGMVKNGPEVDCTDYVLTEHGLKDVIKWAIV